MSAEGALRDGNGATFDLIETMRWQPGAGFLRFERHLARLYASAGAFGFSYDPQRVGETLRGAIGQPETALRVRLVLSPDGDVQASTQPYEALPAHKVWQLRIARERLVSSDALVRHKTSRRGSYMKARSEFEIHQADEVILLNERGEVCEGTITNIFVEGDGGVLRTPALFCGLLPGVLRAELLDEERASEVVLTADDLTDGRRIFVGNSLRGLIPARLGG